jgi:acetylornithine deacetylase/succinyl-diaminopimelate desuccinylase-like protein
MLELNRNRFVSTLARLVACGARLQNAPNAGLIPVESLACDIVEDLLLPLQADGFLTLRRYNAIGQETRPSLVVTVPGNEARTIGLVGAHFDVVPADRVAERWITDPFQLVEEPDGTLRGRGVTDCLGHVALLTEWLLQLHACGERHKRTLHIVMIANEEERSIPGIGLEYVAEMGALEPLKNGPIYWLDSADFGPTLGTGGIVTWELLAHGVAGHSGMPQNCVNALELAMSTAHALTTWFAQTLPAHPDETKWRFSVPSSCKATMFECDNNKITKIPGSARVIGDMRITPFYEVKQTLERAIGYVAELNQRLRNGEQLPGFPRTRTADGQVGSVELRPEGKLGEGIACDLDSPGLHALERAIGEVRGSAVQPYSMTGSLPLVRDLQRRGFDVQITGFGESRSYHAPNEQAKLKDFEDGMRILGKLLEYLD